MIDPRLREIAARCEKASPSPWKAEDIGAGTTAWGIVDARNVMVVMHDFINESNAKFCAHAREDVPYLLQALTDAEQTISALRAQLKEQKEHDVARVDSQPLSGLAELPQRPTEDVPPTAPDKMTHQELLAFLAYRLIALFSDPDIGETPTDTFLRREYDRGVQKAIEFIEAASRDEICAECGFAKHRAEKHTVSLEAFSRQPNARTFR